VTVHRPQAANSSGWRLHLAIDTPWFDFGYTAG